MTHLRVAARGPSKPTFAQIKATALRAGHTTRVIVEYGDEDFYGWIRPSAINAVRFTLIEDEAGTVRNFEGWNTNVRELDD